SLSALISSLAIAGTLLAFAPILVLFLLVLLPLTAAEARYHRRMVELQTTASPALFRMMYLAQRSIDATWQRDIRVHRSTILDDEYRFLASRYLCDLRALLRRYQFIRTAVGLAAAAVMPLAAAAVASGADRQDRLRISRASGACVRPVAGRDGAPSAGRELPLPTQAEGRTRRRLLHLRQRRDGPRRAERCREEHSGQAGDRP